MQIGFNRKAEQLPRPRPPFFSQANDTPTPVTAASLSNDCSKLPPQKLMLKSEKYFMLDFVHVLFAKNHLTQRRKGCARACY
jgi:hypothetical protein